MIPKPEGLAEIFRTKIADSFVRTVHPGDPHGNLIAYENRVTGSPKSHDDAQIERLIINSALLASEMRSNPIDLASALMRRTVMVPISQRASVSISRRSATLLTGSVAGLIGGLVEFGWVTLYTDITGQDSHQFAPGIVSAAVVRGLLPGRPPSLPSVIVNLLFAIILGIVLTLAWQAIKAQKPRLSNPLPFTLAALGVVWAINFLVLLPIIRPEFVHLVPYGVSLTSSLLYGATVAAVLYDGVLRTS